MRANPHNTPTWSFSKKGAGPKTGRTRPDRTPKDAFWTQKDAFWTPHFFFGHPNFKKGAGRFRTQCFRRLCPHPVPTPPVKLPATEAGCGVSLTPANIWGHSLKRRPSTSHPMQAAGTALWWECLQIPAGSPNLIFIFSRLELLDKIHNIGSISPWAPMYPQIHFAKPRITFDFQLILRVLWF